MYIKLFTNVVVPVATPAVSQAVPMNGDNACYIMTVSIVNGAGSGQLQQSNDLTNWTNVGSAITTAAAPSNKEGSITGISGAYVRLVLTASGSTAIFSADINTVNV